MRDFRELDFVARGRSPRPQARGTLAKHAAWLSGTRPSCKVRGVLGQLRGVLVRYDWLSYSAPMRGPAGPRRGEPDDDDPRLSVDLWFTVGFDGHPVPKLDLHGLALQGFVDGLIGRSD